MNVITHLLVSLFLIELTGITGLDILWAITFGVLVDLDHVIKIPLYLKENRF
jgi:hypothetical protein